MAKSPAKFIKLLAEIQSGTYQRSTLDLQNQDLDDADAQALAVSLLSNPSIKALNLSANNIGDEGVIAIAEIKTLSELDLSHNDIGVEGLAALARMQLTSLDIRANYFIRISEEKVHQPAEIQALISTAEMFRNHPHLIKLKGFNSDEQCCDDRHISSEVREYINDTLESVDFSIRKKARDNLRVCENWVRLSIVLGFHRANKGRPGINSIQVLLPTITAFSAEKFPLAINNKFIDCDGIIDTKFFQSHLNKEKDHNKNQKKESSLAKLTI